MASASPKGVFTVARSRETVLYYEPGDGARAEKVKTVLACMGVRIKNVASEATGQTVGHLIGRKDFAETEAAGAALAEPVLVLDGFTEKRLEVLLRELRAHGVAIPYKAMVTAHNLPWTLAALYDELAREHEVMHG